MSSLLVSDIIKMAEKQMTDAGIPSPKVDAEVLYCHLKKVDRARFFMEWSSPADDRTCDQFFELVARRCQREPLQYITGTQDFMGLTLKVAPKVLIPRLDTEVVALAAELKLKEMRGDTVLDLCCGSGAIGLSLAKRGGAKVTAVDISPEAVKLTEINAKNLGAKMTVLQGDLYGPVVKKKYHMIVSNPPYIKSEVMDTLMPEVRKYEPEEALHGGTDGLDYYRLIVEGAHEHLKKNGILVLEIGADQAVDVAALIEETEAFTDIQILQDLDGKDRVVTAKWIKKK